MDEQYVFSLDSSISHVMKVKSKAESVDLKRSADRCHNQGEETYHPRTELGRKLMSIRAKIVASGEPLLNWEEIEREVKERRGEAK